MTGMGLVSCQLAHETAVKIDTGEAMVSWTVYVLKGRYPAAKLDTGRSRAYVETSITKIGAMPITYFIN